MIRIAAEVSAGVFQTIDTYSKVVWQHQLNGNGVFEVLILGGNTDYTGYFQRGIKLSFFKNDVLDMRGVIEKITFTSEGLMRIQGIELGAKVYDGSKVATKTYNSKTTTNVIDDLQGYNNSKLNKGIINSSVFPSFRTHVNQSCLQVLSKVCELQGKDWYFSYSGNITYVNVVTKKGGDNVDLLNGGLDTDVVTKIEDDTAKVLKVKVLGASYGNNQVIGEAVNGWSPGLPELTIVDKSIVSNNEATARAVLELSILGSTRYSYAFKVNDFNRVFATGDTLTIVDEKTNTNALVRVVSVKRVGAKNVEYLELELRSVNERERNSDRLKQDSLNRSFSEDGLAMNQQVDDTTLSGTVDVSVSVSGSAVTSNAHLNKTGSVGTGYNTTDLGYQAYGLSATMISELSHGLTPVYNGNYRFWYHAAYCSFRINIVNTTTIGFHTQRIWIWLQNDNTGECWPDSTGILITDGFGLHLSDSHYHFTDTPSRSYNSYTGYTGPHNHGGYLGIPDDFEHRHTYSVSYGGESNLQSSAPFGNTETFTLWVTGYIQAPKSWQNQSYRLWYKAENGTYWDSGVYAPKVYYGYHGVREPGHAHSDSIGFSDTGHTHSISGSGTGSGTASIPPHTHGTLT